MSIFKTALFSLLTLACASSFASNTDKVFVKGVVPGLYYSSFVVEITPAFITETSAPCTQGFGHSSFIQFRHEYLEKIIIRDLGNENPQDSLFPQAYKQFFSESITQQEGADPYMKLDEPAVADYFETHFNRVYAALLNAMANHTAVEIVYEDVGSCTAVTVVAFNE